MVRITIDKGLWLKSPLPVTLYHETCPKHNCTARPLHYPSYLVAPYCPECKTNLLGTRLVVDSANRVEYHLEA
jgi:hypothetical protein